MFIPILLETAASFVDHEGKEWGTGEYKSGDGIEIMPVLLPVRSRCQHAPLSACATKMYILKNQNKYSIKEPFELGFGKRPEEELYDLRNVPYQMKRACKIFTLRVMIKTHASSILYL